MKSRVREICLEGVRVNQGVLFCNLSLTLHKNFMPAQLSIFCIARSSLPQDLYTLTFGRKQDLGSVILSGKKITQLLIEVHS